MLLGCSHFAVPFEHDGSIELTIVAKTDGGEDEYGMQGTATAKTSHHGNRVSPKAEIQMKVLPYDDIDQETDTHPGNSDDHQ